MLGTLDAVKLQLNRFLSLTSCKLVYPLYASTMYDGVCRHSLVSLSWLFWGVFFVAVFGLVMITLRSSYKPNTYVTLEQDARDRGIDFSPDDKWFISAPTAENSVEDDFEDQKSFADDYESVDREQLELERFNERVRQNPAAAVAAAPSTKDEEYEAMQLAQMEAPSTSFFDKKPQKSFFNEGENGDEDGLFMDGRFNDSVENLFNADTRSGKHSRNNSIEDDQATAEEAFDDMKPSSVDLSDDARKERIYALYKQMDKPDRDAMIERLLAMPNFSDLHVTEDDIDLLPWNSKNTKVKKSKMEKFLKKRQEALAQEGAGFKDGTDIPEIS